MHKSRGQTHDHFAEISRAIAFELCNGGRYLRTFQWEISSPRTQVSFQFFAICIILNIYKRFMLKKLGNKNKNFRGSSTLSARLKEKVEEALRMMLVFKVL